MPRISAVSRFTRRSASYTPAPSKKRASSSGAGSIWRFISYFCRRRPLPATAEQRLLLRKRRPTSRHVALENAAAARVRLIVDVLVNVHGVHFRHGGVRLRDVVGQVVPENDLGAIGGLLRIHAVVRHDLRDELRLREGAVHVIRAGE